MVLNLKLQRALPATLKIFTQDGRLQKMLQIENAASTIDLGMLTKGIYLISLTNIMLTYTTKLKVI
jgi:hypothetical protein